MAKPSLRLPFLACAALCAVAAATAAHAQAPAPPPALGDRPNVVVVMTDDQALRDMRALPRTRALIGRRGATFVNSFVNNPRCCPSRATFLTGQYSHNHGVLTNGNPNGGWPRLRPTAAETLPSWLRAAGYRTAHIGKFMNLYGVGDRHEVPPGWDEWSATVDPTTYRYFGYTLNEDGVLRTYGRDRDPREYSTDLIARRASETVDRLAPAERPFFLSVAFIAPHTGSPRESRDPFSVGTPVVAPRHRGAFASAGLPRTASFNEADVSDKPRWMRRPRLRPWRVAEIEELHRQRLESLLAVDEGVRQIVAALRRSGELDRTLLVFTSDNGYIAGEHRISHGKAKAYEPVTRVPLLIRGPGVPAGVRRRQLVSNADLAPTILDVAGALPGRPQDGRSLIPLARNPAVARARPVLIEVANAVGIRTAAIRTRRWLYIDHLRRGRELYDMRRDPHQLESLHRRRALRHVRRTLARELRALRRCAGADCRRPTASPARRRGQRPAL